MSRKCPKCALPVEGEPRNCPHCGFEIRSHDPGRCEFCGSKIKSAMDTCPNCGAPIDNPAPEPGTADPDDSQDVVVTRTTASSSPSTALKVGGCIVGLAVFLPILIGVVLPLLLCDESTVGDSDQLDSTIEERDVVITPSPMPDSIYRAFIVEGENTVEQVWPRVITDLPDSCYYPDPYDPCAAFQFHVNGEHSLVRLDASAPIDLVMTLVRRNENGSLDFVSWNEDGSQGQDPSVTAVLESGDYIALVTDLGGYEYGEVRFVQTVLMPEIPRLVRDTSITMTMTDRIQRFNFFVNIEQGRHYTFSTYCSSIDTYIELRTEEGTILSDDDSGDSWNNARLSFTAGALHAGEAVLIVRPYNAYSIYTGEVTLEVTSEDGGSGY